MAVLQKIRNKGVLLVTIIAIALFLFVVGDALRSGEGMFNQSKQQVGEIDGNTVSIQDYQSKVEELKIAYEIMRQKSSFSEDELNSINDEAWQEIVSETLIGKECAALGISATNDEIADVIRNGASQLLQVPFFMNQQTGRFDYSSLQAFLTEYKKLKETSGQQVPEAYEKIYKYYLYAQKSIRNQILANKYQVLFSKCILSNPVEAELSYNGRANENQILLASVPFSSVDDNKVTVTDEEIKSKYNEDKEQYRQYIETRDIKVIDVPVTASAEDKKNAEKEMNEVYTKLQAADSKAAASIVRSSASQTFYTDIMKTKDAYPRFISQRLDSIAVGETVKPIYDVMSNTFYTFKVLGKANVADSVLYRQLVVEQGDASQYDAKADSILQAINAGATFKSIAKKYNQAGDSAWVATRDFQSSSLDTDNLTILNALYSMSKGEVRKLTMSNGAIVIMQVDDKRNFIEKYNVASVVKELKFSDQTYNTEYNKFSSFMAANNSAEKISQNADKAGYHIQTLTDVASNTHNIAGVSNTRDALKWVFDDAKPGDVSQLYECGSNDHLMLVILTTVNEKGYATVEKVKEYITSELKNDKKAEQIIASLKDVKSIDQAKSKSNVVVDTVSHVSFADATFVRATNSSEPVIGAIASKTSKGAFASAFKGNNGVYMLTVLNKEKSSSKFDDKSEESTIISNAQRTAFNTLMQDLYFSADITDTRYKFF